MSNEANFLSEPGALPENDDAEYEALRQQQEGGTDDPPQAKQPKEGAQPEDKKTPEAEKDTKTVPYAALHEEREMRKEMQEELRALREQNQNLTSRFTQFDGLRAELEQLRGKRNVEEEKAKAEAEFERDPVGYMRRRVEELEGKLSQKEVQENQNKERNEKLTADQQEFLKFQQTISDQVTSYIEKQPDYPDAFKYLMSARIKELKAIGITSTADIQRAIDQESFALAQVAMQRGVNPGEAAYNLAVARGYTKAEDGNEDEGKDKGGEDTLTDQLKRLEQGLDASKTLSGGGKDPKGALTLSEINDLSDEDFDKLWDSMATDANSGNIFDG